MRKTFLLFFFWSADLTSYFNGFKKKVVLVKLLWVRYAGIYVEGIVIHF